MNEPLQRAEEVGGAQDEREGDEVAHEDAGEQHEGQLAAAGAHHRRAAPRQPHAAHQPADTRVEVLSRTRAVVIMTSRLNYLPSLKYF